jgi:putative colanic acid biosynthesis acetyltransferase WcaF
MTASTTIPSTDPRRIEANPHSLKNQLVRTLWNITSTLFFRYTPRPAHVWRVALLKAFGAQIDWTARPYPKCKIWLPSNLIMGPHSCLADGADCYNVAPVTLDEFAIVSQYSYLCSATHDINDPNFPLLSRPIKISQLAWVAARCFVGPGVTLGEGAVAGANSCVYRDVAEWTVVGGNPARPIAVRRKQ